MPKPSVLVVADEEVITALLGAMIELDGYQPTFPSSDERPLDAVRRVRPALVLLDGEHELAWDAAAMQTLRGLGVQVLLVSALRSQQDLDVLAARYDLPALALPVRFREFTSELERLISQPVS